MNYEWFVAKRYIWSKRKHPFVGVISTISILGICVGVAALIVVLAVMNGFDEDLKNRIIGMHAHLVVEKDGSFLDWRAVQERLGKMDFVKGSSAYVEGQALLQKDEWGAGVLVRGIDLEKEKEVSHFFDYLTQGALTEKSDSAVVGAELAKKFRLKLGDEISVLSQNAKRPVLYRVEGIFSSGMYEYDANLLFLNLPSAQKLFELGDAVSGVSISLKKSETAPQAKRIIQRELGAPYFAQTWMDMNKTLFGALKLEKIVMFLILALIILVACLNIAGSLTILVVDKTRDIGILKALGATPVSIMKIFALDGLFVGGVGAGVGFLLGTGICFSLKRHSFFELPKEIYYTSHLPVQMNGWDNGLILAVAVGLSFLAALYPAWIAGTLDPVKALRYE